MPFNLLTGSTNRITISPDGTNVLNDHEVTISTPQDIHTGATPTFAGATFNGMVGIGATPGNDTALLISGAVTSISTQQYGIRSDATVSSATTTAAFGGFFRVNTATVTAPNAYTVSSVYGVAIYNVIPGSYSTITTQYGLYIEAMTSGSTNYAIYTNSGAVRFGGAVTCASTLSVTGASTLSSTLRIDGVASIGAATNSGIMLYLAGDTNITTGSTSQFGLFVNLLGPAATVSDGLFGIRTGVNTPASASAIVSNAYGLYVEAANKGAGSTITNNYGIIVKDQTVGGTLNYAIYTQTGLVSFGDAVTCTSTLTVTGATTLSSTLTIGGALRPSRQTFSDANVTCNSTTTMLAQTGTLTANRTVTLPSASAFGAGVLIIVDESGTSASNKKIIVSTSANVNGTSSKDAIVAGYGMAILYCNGTNWTITRFTAI